MKTIKVDLPLKKETKGAYQYQAEEQDGIPVTTVYVRKFAVEGQPPKSVKVTVEAGK